MSIRHLALAVCSGILFGSGFLVSAFWPLTLIGIVPLLFALRDARSLAASFFYGWLASMTLALLVFGPIFWGTLPLDWYGFPAVWVGWLAIGVSWLQISAVFALGGGIFGMLFRGYRANTWFDIFTVPFAWVLSEWMGAYLFSIINAGPGTLIGANLTLIYLGYAVANDPAFLQLARFGDVYAMSFAAVAVGTLAYRWAQATKRECRMISVAAGVLVVLWLCVHALLPTLVGQARASAESASASLVVATISRNAPPLLHPSAQEEESRFEELRALVKPLRNVDMLIFPEDSVYLRSIRQYELDEALKELRQLNESHQPLVIDTEDLVQPNGTIFSRLTYFNDDTNTVYSYKQFLTPFGEYVPHVYRFVVTILGGGDFLRQVLDVRSYAAGPYANVVSKKGIEIAARFCGEVESPNLYKRQVQEGANMLVNLSSQSWFHGSHYVYEEMKQVSRVRAVALGRWYVHSANMDPAFVLDQYGQLVGETRWGMVDVLVTHVPKLSGHTLATVLGDYILLLPLAWLLAVTWYRKRHE